LGPLASTTAAGTMVRYKNF